MTDGQSKKINLEIKIAKVVDKEQKRREIAIACTDLLFEVGIRKLTISQAAIAAGIGKGTIYEYFENKDDIVFEIINMIIENYHDEFLEAIKNLKTTKEKLFCFLKFVMDDSDSNLKEFNAFKEYLAVVLSDDNTSMKKYNNSCHIFFKEQLFKIIKEGIEKKELIPEAIEFIDGLLVFERGLSLLKMTQENFNTNEICINFINSIFKFIEIKKNI